MESSRSRGIEKRKYKESLEDEDSEMPQPKRPKLPNLASVIVEALKVDSLQRLCSSLEPLFRRIVSEEVERALTRLGHANSTGGSSPPRIQGPENKGFQLHFKTRMPHHLFTGGKVEGSQGAAIHVVLVDTSTGSVLQTGPESAAKLNIVVLEGDFNDEANDDWTEEHFESHEVKAREGKRPLLTGDIQVTLKEGVGTLGDLIFTDNSSWIRSRKFRLGVKVASGYCDGVRVREAKTEAFLVKDHRGELYKKHYPPVLHDEVWRLDRIAKDGALHKKLVKSQITTVEDFLRVLVRDPQSLRNILGSGMSNKMWENTVEHAKTCVLGGKLYVYYGDGTHSTGVVFNHIYELRGLIANGQFLSLEYLSHDQKISVDSLVKRAYEDWNQVVEYDGKVLNSLSTSKNAITATIADHNHFIDHYSTSTHEKYQNIPVKIETKSNVTPIPQLIEFPLIKSESTVQMTLNTLGGFSGNMDYGSSGMSIIGNSYLPEEWSRPREGQGVEDFFSEDIRVRSSEMLESDDMQRLLRNFGVESTFGNSDEGFYSYDAPYDHHQVDRTYEKERGPRSSGKAVVGWLKLKAALRWGIFIRKKAAERRAQLVELD